MESFSRSGKLWNRLDYVTGSIEEKRWELHKRAAAAEAIVEGTLVKLSSELTLSEEEINTLGCFRQSFQQLRQSIHSNLPLPWVASDAPEYVAFKTLAVGVSALLGGEWPSRSVPLGTARQQLLDITSNIWEGQWMNYATQLMSGSSVFAPGAGTTKHG
jgi:hypothetical protein